MSIAGTTIAGAGHYAPEQRVTNAEIEQRLGLEPGWIKRRTGIEERRYAAPEQALTDIAFPAADMALRNAGIDRNAVALTLLATSTPDNPLPPSAPLLTHKLGLSNSGGIDMAGACGGFLYALALGDSFARIHRAPVLVVAANILSRRINPAERASSVLFADAAGAVVLLPTDRADTGVLGASLATDGSAYGLIQIAGGGSRRPFAADLPIEETLMTITDGKAVFVRAVEMMTDASQKALAMSALELDLVDWLVPHQANGRIIAAVSKQLGMPSEQVLSSVAAFGNSSAATIPFTLSLAMEAGQVQPGQTLLMCAAGAGLTGGAVVYRC
ncbi:beta-ketoacyl-ACP synthase III [Hyphomicrobium sp. D-2]|uniref:beta-ketoacyl-ACP synthase III n=1 Tax=Hyphomicrobium sp. D-2 TaxID=3041621 RepID=UPI002458CA97|nr:beta-ketoacyl-ACP synthase III [Hyphomicrobium sp. D-2]MDH4983578.1 beta-ketoacyl-ACP synthase III [Hyphomicrobium sp. D-2]